MTVKEKRDMLRDYCAGVVNCDECLLAVGGWEKQGAGGCLTIMESGERDLNRALALIGVRMTDPVNSPAHYTDGKIEVIEYIEDKKLGFCLGNAVKYISRAGKKDPTKEVEDLKKAIWYLERRIKEVEEASGND